MEMEQGGGEIICMPKVEEIRPLRKISCPEKAEASLLPPAWYYWQSWDIADHIISVRRFTVDRSPKKYPPDMECDFVKSFTESLKLQRETIQTGFHFSRIVGWAKLLRLWPYFSVFI